MSDPDVVTEAPNLVSLLRESMVSDVPRGTLRERGLGVLMGLAAGNLLGLPVEGDSRLGIASRYPSGVKEIRTMERRMPMDDDLAQAVDLGEAVLGGGNYLDEFASRLVRWRRENGRGIGITTSAVIDLLEQGIPVPNAARRIYDQRDRIAPNGGIMRCAPVALARRSDPEALVRDSAATCVVTHYAPTCQWSCIILNAAVAMLLNCASPDAGLLADVAVSDGAPVEVAEWVGRTGDEVITHQLDQGHIGHTLLALQVGMWSITTPLVQEHALTAVVSGGGDTDTNGAVAGAVLGARYGVQGIPDRWLKCVPQSGRLESLADGLLGLGA